ncbi:SRPBCC family protein [Sphingomonas immobilis]|uniref:SRPBCC family protein n=1 Tax=Sphingomonas immobilis TaxID=3063997 RepID=A0ABT8ZXS6_9SPHN|nr:SRPBCC family protein [Sphingomonas sp. CA1-15]MDO7842386.1 SRPBCC family protein [Sphingomonas sp. CA1-15]
MKLTALLATAAALFLAAPASAEIVESAADHFEVKQVVTVEAPVQQVWETLRAPQKWWSKDHTYSDDAANLYLDSQATGCFCEKLADKGSVEHAHIIYIQPPRMIRLDGALGPLQAEAVKGTLTFKVDPGERGATTLTMTYLVAGYMRAGGEKLAPQVDEVLALQVLNLKAAAEAAPPPPPEKAGR